MTQEEINARQRTRRKLNHNADVKKYEKTIPGFLMRAYRNMESRIKGIQKKKAHLYHGLDLLNREAFYAWSRNNWTFYRLWLDWESSNYDRRLTPSINRIDSNGGYVLDNMEWVTHSENSRQGALSQWHGKTDPHLDVFLSHARSSHFGAAA